MWPHFSFPFDDVINKFDDDMTNVIISYTIIVSIRFHRNGNVICFDYHTVFTRHLISNSLLGPINPHEHTFFVVAFYTSKFGSFIIQWWHIPRINSMQNNTNYWSILLSMHNLFAKKYILLISIANLIDRRQSTSLIIFVSASDDK